MRSLPPPRLLHLSPLRYGGAETWELFNVTDLGCDKERCTGVRGYRDLVKVGVLQGGRDFPRIKEFFAWTGGAASGSSSSSGGGGSSGALRGAGPTPGTTHLGLSTLVGLRTDNTMCGSAPRSKICTFSPSAAVVLAAVGTLAADPVRVRLQWPEVDALCFDPVLGGFQAGQVTSLARGTSPTLPITMGVLCPPGPGPDANTDRVIVLRPRDGPGANQ